MINVILTVVVVVVVVAAVAYIIKAKKSGQKCIGCPDAGVCGKGESECNCGK